MKSGPTGKNDSHEVRYFFYLPEGQMTNPSSSGDWIIAAAVVICAAGLVVATLFHFGSNPVGLTLMCLVGAGCLGSWLQDQRR